LIASGIEPSWRIDPARRTLAGAEARLHPAECQPSKRRASVGGGQERRAIVTPADRRTGKGEAE
jgi:hypothetical protein